MGEEKLLLSSGQLAKNAAKMGSATLISRVLGLVREQVFASLFGAGVATDAFNIAFRIPNLLRDLFAEGALSAALVPTFVSVREKEGERRAWQVARRVFISLVVIVSAITAVGILFAPELVRVYASAYEQDPEKFALTVRLTRELYPFFPWVALAAAFMAVLNALGVFFLPALSSALFNLVSIVTGVALAKFSVELGFEHPIEGMAAGVVLGGAVQALCQLPSLWSQGYRRVTREPADPSPLRDPALRKLFWLMVPGTLGLAATQINILVNSILATSQGTGAVSWLNYAFRLMQFPIGVFGVSLAGAALPVVARTWVRGEAGGTAQVLRSALRQVIFINLAASAGLIALGDPLIALLFQHGRFEAFDTLQTARALAAYSIGLTGYSVVKVLVPACYSMGLTRVAVVSSVFSVGVNLAVSSALVREMGFVGLALGTSATAILNMLMIWAAIRWKLRQAGTRLGTPELLFFSLRSLIVAAGMGGFVFLWVRYASKEGEAFLSASHLARSLEIVGIGLVIGGLGVVILSKALRIKEAEEFAQWVVRKVRRK